MYAFNRAPVPAAFPADCQVPRHGPDCLLTLGAAVPPSLFDVIDAADYGTILLMLGIPFASLALIIFLIQRMDRRRW